MESATNSDENQCENRRLALNFEKNVFWHRSVFFNSAKNDQIHKTLPETFLCPNMESDIVLESLGPTAWRDGLGFLDFGKILELARVIEHTITGKFRQNVNMLQSAPKLAIMIRISC